MILLSSHPLKIVLGRVVRVNMGLLPPTLENKVGRLVVAYLGNFPGGGNVLGGARIMKFELFHPKKAFHIKKMSTFSMLGLSRGGATVPPAPL